jgi:hypothetical protein
MVFRPTLLTDKILKYLASYSTEFNKINGKLYIFQCSIQSTNNKQTSWFVEVPRHFKLFWNLWRSLCQNEARAKWKLPQSRDDEHFGTQIWPLDGDNFGLGRHHCQILAATCSTDDIATWDCSRHNSHWTILLCHIATPMSRLWHYSELVWCKTTCNKSSWSSPRLGVCAASNSAYSGYPSCGF